MSALVCCVCFLDFKNSRRRVPACGRGHVFCSTCLPKQKSSKGLLCCPLCKEDIKASHSPDESAPSRRTPQTLAFFCLNCEKDAIPSCEQGGHLLRSLAAQRSKQQAQESEEVRRTAKALWEALSKTMSKIMEVDGTLRRQFESAKLDQENAQRLAATFEYLGTVARQGGVDQSLWQKELLRARECDDKLSDVQRGLNMLNLESGSLRVDLRAARVNGGPERTFTANLDLAGMASRQPDILAATKYLLFLLSKGDCLGDEQINQSQRRHQPGDAVRHESTIDAMIADDGLLDLKPSGIGSAELGEKEAEKRALLSSTKLVNSLTGLDCSKDSSFCTRMVKKHTESLESLALRNVQQEQFSLLRDLPLLKHLDLRNCKGRLSAAKLPSKAQPGRGDALRSMYVSLPFKIQADLWEAFAPSLVNVTLRVEVQSNLDVHRTIGPLAAKTPNLRNIHMTRKKEEEHSEDGCARQTAGIKKEVANDIRVSCNLCRAANVDE